MWNDPIVKEVRAAREALMQKFDYDLDRMLRYFQEHYPDSAQQGTSRGPKRPSQQRTGAPSA